MAELLVFLGSQEVGRIAKDADGRIRFRYTPEWILGEESFPISASLPLSGGWVAGLTDHRWFSNLLPEGDAREVLARELGVVQDDSFALLEKAGRECAGALVIVSENERNPLDEPPAIAWLDENTFRDKVQTRNPQERIVVAGRVRLSLAGAQSKWAVCVGPQGGIGLPQGSQASTHILKFASHRFKGIEHNEAFMSFVAARLGLDVVAVEAREHFSLVKRYDRLDGPPGAATRIHQEDLCQAQGLPASSKYESLAREVSLASCIQVVRDTSTVAGKDVDQMIRWQLANWLLGNSDGHAKNLSLLYTPQGARLAPIYDLVCTVSIDNVDHNMGLSVGGVFDPGQIRQKNLFQMAQDCRVRPTLVTSHLDALRSRIDSNLESWAHEYLQSAIGKPKIDRIVQTIKRQIRRTAVLLTQP